MVSRIAASVLLLSPCLAGEPTPAETAEALKAAGGLHFDRREYPAAAEKWRAAVEVQPDSVDLRNRLGMALTKLKQYDKAKAEFKAAAALDPDEPRSLFNLALLYIHAGDLRLAEKTLRNTLRAGSWYPETHYHLGLIAESSGDVKMAIDEYTKELNVNAGCAKAWLRLEALRRKEDGSARASKSDFGLMVGAIGFGIGLACLLLSKRRSHAMAAMALAMLAAGSAQAEVDYGVYQSGVQQEDLKERIDQLSLSHPSRVLGYDGCKAAAKYIQDEFKRIGLSDVAADTFTVPMPIDKGTWLTIVATGKRHRIHPLWPNLVRPPILRDGGVTGNLIDAGGGVLSEVDG